jgi:5-amino-6-(5-phospho-D-ribitylamino)uracil phosphatase
MDAIKLIALDLDGTLLTDEKTVTAETKLWIRRAVHSGVTVMFSTGRGIQTAGSIWDELELNSPMVLLNGAEIWEGPGRFRKRTFLPRKTVRRLHAAAVSHSAGYWGYSVESLTGSREWTEEMFERDWMKFGIKHDDQAVLAAIRRQLEGEEALTITASAPTNLEISVQGVTKESGVREVCEMLGIAMNEVMAVGDSDNDVCLLCSAGLGIAMGNAEEHVKSIADAVTGFNNDGGVAQAIRRFVFGCDDLDCKEPA